jgi:hypothetical protein
LKEVLGDSIEVPFPVAFCPSAMPAERQDPGMC